MSEYKRERERGREGGRERTIEESKETFSRLLETLKRSSASG